MLDIGGSPNYYGCLKCWLKGLGKAGGKMVYCGHGVFLPNNHPLRDPLSHLYSKVKVHDVWTECTAALPKLRTHEEVMAQIHKPDAGGPDLGSSRWESWP